MKLHILGVCGTFMGGLARLTKELGYQVTGTDQHVYPPMSDILNQLGIPVSLGYTTESVPNDVDLVLIGNTVKRGNPAVEQTLNKNIPYQSGAQWIYETVLKTQHVLAVSGTHGKTTTTALLAWILETAGLQPGFMVGGVPKNFNQTCRLGAGKYFVIEADEYDTAFFDKRSKFLHYRPRTLIINNIEFDHADIFENLEAIKKQFQYLLRCVPGSGTTIYPASDTCVNEVLSRGCWSTRVPVGIENGWQAKLIHADGSQFELWHRDQKLANITWNLIGKHNVQNALTAIAAAHHAGVGSTAIEKAFATFQNVKRRLEVRGCVNNITVYDDFAHHPTAIATTIDGLRKKVGNERIIVIAQLGSNTMRSGVHGVALGESFVGADQVYILQPENENWDVMRALQPLGGRARCYASVSDIVKSVSSTVIPTDHVLIMSNKGFDGIHEKLLQVLR